MALGALSLSDENVGFDSQGTAMVPVSSGESKLGTIELKSPLDTLKTTFNEMKESLSAMVGLQTKEAKQQALIDKKLFEQAKFERKMANEKFVASGMSGPLLPSGDDFEGVDTDKENVPEERESIIGGILSSLKDSFQQVEFGEKMTALLMAGGLFLFMKYKDQIIKVLTPVIDGIMNLVEFLGGPENSLMVLFGGILLIKLFPIIKLLGSLVKFLGGKFLKGIKALRTAFTAMRLFMMETLIPGIKKSYTSGKFGKVLKMLGRAFTAMRVFMNATLIPALMTIVTSMSAALAPFLIPLGIIVAVAGGIALVLFSLKSGFETFKKSLDDGDSMFTAVLESVGDFFITLVTLPGVLMIKLLSWLAGLLGFDGIKEKLDKFDFKKMVGDTIKNMFSGIVRLVKAVASGVGAAFAAALPGGKTPQAEFARAFGEVMASGKDAPINEADVELGLSTQTMGDFKVTSKTEKQGDANVAESFYADKRNKKALMANSIIGQPSGFDDILGDPSGSGTSSMTAGQATVAKQKSDAATLKAGPMFKNAAPVIINNKTDKQGDVYNQKSETNVTGELEVNNTESSQRLINAMSA